MNLNKFNKENMAGLRTGECCIRFNKAGACTISQAAVIELGLQSGDKIAIFQDQDTPEDWYMMVGDAGGFPLRDTGKDSKALAFNSAIMAKTIMDAFGMVDNKSVSFKLATEPTHVETQAWGGVKLYAIITASAVAK